MIVLKALKLLTIYSTEVDGIACRLYIITLA